MNNECREVIGTCGQTLLLVCLKSGVRGDIFSKPQAAEEGDKLQDEFRVSGCVLIQENSSIFEMGGGDLIN